MVKDLDGGGLRISDTARDEYVRESYSDIKLEDQSLIPNNPEPDDPSSSPLAWPDFVLRSAAAAALESSPYDLGILVTNAPRIKHASALLRRAKLRSTEQILGPQPNWAVLSSSQVHAQMAAKKAKAAPPPKSEGVAYR